MLVILFDTLFWETVLHKLPKQLYSFGWKRVCPPKLTSTNPKEKLTALKIEEERQMQRRDNLTHLILVNVVVLVLTPLMVAVEAQAQIVFQSDRDGHVHPRLGWPSFEIYVMEVDGNNQRRLTNHPNLDTHPSWSS